MNNFWKLLSVFLCFMMIGMARLPAIELADGKTYFLNPPQLLETRISQNETSIWGVTYYFTLTIPEDAGESLQSVLIVQENGGITRPLFEAKNVEVFEGVRGELGRQISIQKSTFEPESIALTVQFDPPILPGKTITIRLYPVRNPRVAGTYLYGVTVFPAGKQPHGQYIGAEQIKIYDSNLE